MLTPVQCFKSFMVVAMCGMLSCTSERQRQGFAFSSNLGVVVDDSGHQVLEIHNAAITAGTKMSLVNPSEHSVAEASAGASHACPDVVADDPGIHCYAVDRKAFTFPAIAVLAAPDVPQVKGESVTADLSGAGSADTFRACTSTEGVHFTVWQGEPLKGKPEWHQYAYLGYDLEPNCTPQEEGTAAGK